MVRTPGLLLCCRGLPVRHRELMAGEASLPDANLSCTLAYTCYRATPSCEPQRWGLCTGASGTYGRTGHVACARLACFVNEQVVVHQRTTGVKWRWNGRPPQACSALALLSCCLCPRRRPTRSVSARSSASTTAAVTPPAMAPTGEVEPPCSRIAGLSEVEVEASGRGAGVSERGPKASTCNGCCS